jgi:uncharacterized glyoxalase superfamily protein PhnB
MSQSTSHIPEGFHTVTPYLTIAGAEALLDFVKRVFDAEELSRTDHEGRIAHASVRIGDSVVELSEARGEWPPMPGALHVYLPDVDEAYRRAVEAGAASLFEPTDQVYGERGAGVRDHAGNHWYLATLIENVSEEEIARRMKGE